MNIIEKGITMRLHEFINITHNFESMWNYLCEKKMVYEKIMCQKCKNEIQLCNVSKNHIFHRTQKYYEVIKNRNRQRITCNLMLVHSMEHSSIERIWISLALSPLFGIFIIMACNN